jgi:hypothetical protein
MPASESIFAKYLDLEKEPPEVDPAVKLLEWITYKWNGATITGRDIYRHGPHFLRDDREGALSLAKVLTQRGNLIPTKTRQHNMREWHIIREPIRK